MNFIIYLSYQKHKYEKLFKFIIVLAFPLFFKISFAQTTKITESEKELINRTLSNMVDSDQLVSLPQAEKTVNFPKRHGEKCKIAFIVATKLSLMNIIKI